MVDFQQGSRGGAGRASLKRRLWVLALLVLTLTATSCAEDDAGGEILPADEVCAGTRTDETSDFYAVNDIYVDEETTPWRTASPEEVGLDAVELEAAADNLALSKDVASLLVVRHGKLVLERYFNGNEATHANNVHSLSKSILSAVTGIAVAEGHLERDEAVSDALPEGMAGDNGGLTVRNLLTMSGGLDWSENETEYEIDGDHSHVAAVLAQPQVAPPGSEFLYNTGLTQTLSAVLAENLGDSLCEYAHERLFEPLGIDVDHWKVDPDGYYAGGHSVFLTPRELAVFGQLILQGGVWGEDQLVPSDWLDESLEPAWNLECSPGDSVRVEYGYLWWIHDLDGFQVWTADGYAGQRLFIVPDLDMIVVMTHMTQKGDGIEVVSPIALLRSMIAAVFDAKVLAMSECSMWLDLHEVDVDGTESRQLNAGAFRAVPWSLSPDRSRFAFHADTDLNYEIYTSSLDGAELTRLTIGYAADVLPDWSPDGRTIVFARGEPGAGDLYTINEDGSGLEQLTDFDGGESSPTWSPDGVRIAFIREEEGKHGIGEAGELWVFDVESGDTERLLEGPAWSPSWSPDGARIAYVSNTDNGSRISVLDIDTGDVSDLGLGYFPRWSPDGAQIAFVAEGVDGQELFLVGATGDGREQLTDHPQRVVYPLWSGRETIAFVAEASRE
jgi:CubicO group peptidase (beta-lactamase class C family)